MYLSQLNLQNFRNFGKQTFSFSPQTTLILGPNTSGKTNILEAIYLLATGHSFRAEVEKEIISYGEEIGRVKGVVSDGELEIVLTTGQVAKQPAPHKKYLVNDVSKRMIDFLGNLRAVLFWPEDLELVTNSPSLRRKYLDLVLSQVDREYRRCLLSYEKGLRQRNRLLMRIRDEGTPPSQLLFWNQLLIKNGGVLTDKRQEFIEFVNSQMLFPRHSGLSRIPTDEDQYGFQLEYEKSIISQARLEQYAGEEIAAGATLVGPHRDDFTFTLVECDSFTPRDLSLYGSRGEQRLAVLWLKLCELEFVTSKTGDPSTGSGQGRPILLLDDIFSELDHQHRKYVLKVIPSQQTIMTTTDLHLVEEEYLKEVQIIKL